MSQERGRIEFRVIGADAEGKAYLDLAEQLREEWEEYGPIVQIPRLFSEPVTAAVVVGITVGVGTHVVIKLVDRLLATWLKEPEGKKTDIRIWITNNFYFRPQPGDKAYRLPEDKEKLLRDVARQDEDDQEE